MSKDRRSSSRKSVGEEPASTYPNVCNICKKPRIQYKGKKVTRVTKASFQAQETIKTAAKAKDQNMKWRILDHCRETLYKGFGEQSREKLKSGEPEIYFKLLNFSKTSSSILKKFYAFGSFRCYPKRIWKDFRTLLRAILRR